MLLRLIDDGMATRLYHRLCDSSGLCYSASAGYEAYEDCGLVEFDADTSHERCYDVVNELLRLTNEMTTELVSEPEWERIRKRTRWQFEAYRDEASASADFTAMASLFGTAQTPDLRLDALLAVTRQEIQAVASAVFAKTSRSLVCVGNPRKARIDRLRTLALQ
jgi:predicted Zn-dependent peptidase